MDTLQYFKQEIDMSSDDDDSLECISPTSSYDPFSYPPQAEVQPNQWPDCQHNTWMESIDVRDLYVQDELTEQRLKLELILTQLRTESHERRLSSIDYGVATPSPTTSEGDMFTDNVFGSDTKIRLYEFVLHLLEDNHHDCIRWVCPNEGEFEITNSSKIALLWGQVKRNPNMTYEKFARALRHYYKLGILVHYKHKEKLRYKFSKDILKKNKANK